MSTAALVVLGVLVFPWVASATQVERAGRRLDGVSAAPDGLGALTEPQGEGSMASEAAEKALRSALRWDARNAQAYRLLAGLYEQRADKVQAAAAWQRFTELRPQDPQGYWELASICAGMDLAEVARSETGHSEGEEVARSETGHSGGSETGHSGGDPPCGADASSRQERLIGLWRSAGQSAEDLSRGGDSFRDQDKPDQAMAFYRWALLLDPKSARAWGGLAGLYLAQGEVEAALDAYSQVAAFGQDPAMAAAAHSSRGQILADAGRWEGASDELAQAVALAPDRGEYHLTYGWYLVRAGEDGAMARQEFARAASLMPANAWPYVHLANLEFVAKDYVAALDHARLAVQLQPDLFWGWVWQGKALAELGWVADAEESLRRAVELAPDKAAPHADLGQFLKRQGRLDEAIAEYEQAVHLAEGDVSYWLSLADVYRADGHLEQAVTTYQQVLELDPTNSAALQALQELGH